MKRTDYCNKVCPFSLIAFIVGLFVGDSAFYIYILLCYGTYQQDVDNFPLYLKGLSYFINKPLWIKSTNPPTITVIQTNYTTNNKTCCLSKLYEPTNHTTTNDLTTILTTINIQTSHILSGFIMNILLKHKNLSDKNPHYNRQIIPPYKYKHRQIIPPQSPKTCLRPFR